MSELIKKSEPKKGWYPASISQYYRLLTKSIKQGNNYVHVDALKKNIAYNLQYLEFIDRCLIDLKLSSVIVKQNIKIFIMVGSSIVESLLHYLIMKNNIERTERWELEDKFTGSPKKVNGQFKRYDTHVYSKLSTPKQVQMNFDSMLKKAESKKLFGTSDTNLYPRLNYLRQLRNRVHLQMIGHGSDTDYNAFGFDDMCAMAQALHSIFTSGIFRPSEEEKGYFEYLTKYKPVELDL